MLAAVVGAEGMWKSVVSISKVCVEHTPSFPPPFRLGELCDQTQALKELGLGQLHAFCSLGIADRGSDALQGIGAQSWT